MRKEDCTCVDVVYREVEESLDLICVEGNAASPDVLREAGAAQAELLVAAMETDEVNMVCAIAARKLGCGHAIARVRDPRYLRQQEFFRDALGLSYILNPEYECAAEISRVLRFPGAARVDTFSKGSVELVEYRVVPGDRLIGLPLKSLAGQFGAKVLVSVAERGSEALIPNGDFIPQAGDRLSIAGTAKELRKFFAAFGHNRKRVRSAILMGGSRLAVYLARILEESGIAVTVIDRDRGRCEELCELIPQARIVCGDGSNSDVLDEEGLRTSDAFVALTGDDGENIATSLYVKSQREIKIITKVNREHFSRLMEAAGLDSVVAPRLMVAQQIARYVRAMNHSRGSSMETLYRLAEGKVEALEFRVGEDSACVGTPLKELKIKANILVCALIRGSTSIIPNGDTHILPGDHAIVVSAAGRLTNLDEIVEAT